jgi:hypothetical protein
MTTVKHSFVELIPNTLADNTIYISVTYKTAIHKCLCGCGLEVVTPISPTDWRITFDGETISLFPSIGNWSQPCRSHYWIKNSNVISAPAWSEDEILAGRDRDTRRKRKYYDSLQREADSELGDSEDETSATKHQGIFSRIRSWLEKLT